MEPSLELLEFLSLRLEFLLLLGGLFSKTSDLLVLLLEELVELLPRDDDLVVLVLGRKLKSSLPRSHLPRAEPGRPAGFKACYAVSHHRTTTGAPLGEPKHKRSPYRRIMEVVADTRGGLEVVLSKFVRPEIGTLSVTASDGQGLRQGDPRGPSEHLPEDPHHVRLASERAQAVYASRQVKSTWDDWESASVSSHRADLALDAGSSNDLPKHRPPFWLHGDDAIPLACVDRQEDGRNHVADAAHLENVHPFFEGRMPKDLVAFPHLALESISRQRGVLEQWVSVEHLDESSAGLFELGLESCHGTLLPGGRWTGSQRVPVHTLPCPGSSRRPGQDCPLTPILSAPGSSTAGSGKMLIDVPPVSVSDENDLRPCPLVDAPVVALRMGSSLRELQGPQVSGAAQLVGVVRSRQSQNGKGSPLVRDGRERLQDLSRNVRGGGIRLGSGLEVDHPLPQPVPSLETLVRDAWALQFLRGPLEELLWGNVVHELLDYVVPGLPSGLVEVESFRVLRLERNGRVVGNRHRPELGQLW